MSELGKPQILEPLAFSSADAPEGSITMQIARMVGDNIKAMNAFEDAALALGESNHLEHSRLKRLEAASFRRLTAGHELIPYLPAETLKEAAVLMLHVYATINSISDIDLPESMPEVRGMRADLERARTGAGTLVRTLSALSELDLEPYGFNYYAGITLTEAPLGPDSLPAEPAQGGGDALACD